MKIPALELIPQRDPIVLVDYLLECSETTTICEYAIRSNTLFLQNDRMPATALIENIAQTCAARVGYLNRKGGNNTGVIGGIKNFEIFREPLVGERLQTEIKVIAVIGAAVVADACIYANDELVASSNIKVFVRDNDENKNS